jgi:hypothetical protein
MRVWGVKPTEAALGGFVISAGFIFIFFLIGIAIMRWAFRINDIVKRLDRLIELQEGIKTSESPQPKYAGVVGIGG